MSTYGCLPVVKLRGYKLREGTDDIKRLSLPPKKDHSLTGAPLVRMAASDVGSALRPAFEPTPCKLKQSLAHRISRVHDARNNRKTAQKECRTCRRRRESSSMVDLNRSSAPLRAAAAAASSLMVNGDSDGATEREWSVMLRAWPKANDYWNNNRIVHSHNPFYPDFAQHSRDCCAPTLPGLNREPIS